MLQKVHFLLVFVGLEHTIESETFSAHPHRLTPALRLVCTQEVSRLNKEGDNKCSG